MSGDNSPGLMVAVDPSNPLDEPVVMSPQPSIRRVATILMSGALANKVLGFGREILMAQVIGASLIADAFRGALTVILLPLAFLQNESVPAILIPMHRKSQSEGNAPQHLAAVTMALTFVAFILMVLIQAFGEWSVQAVVGGFSAEGRAMTLEFVRIMALGMPASTLINCLAGGEIAMGRTRLTNLRAGLLNISLIGGIAVLALTGHVAAIAWAFSLAFNALAIWAVWILWREGLLSFSGVGPAMVFGAGMDFLRRLRPLLALPVAEQGQVWVERLLASRLATGAVASLDYARTLSDSALLLVSQPVGLAVLSRDPAKDARAQIESIARPVLAVAVPAAAYLALFAPDIVRLVFYRGAFSEQGVEMTSQVLRGTSVGLWALTLGWILLRVLNNTGRNLTAVMILVASYGVNIALNLLTSELQATSGNGLLLLGLGEAARGFVLLGGIVLALDCRRRLSFLIALAMIPAAAMLFLGWQVQEALTGNLERLFVGGLACAACMALSTAILIPATWRTVLLAVRRKLLPASGGQG